MSTSDRMPLRPVQRLDSPRAFRRCLPSRRIDSGIDLDIQSTPTVPPPNAKAASHFRELLPEYLRVIGGEDWSRVEPRFREIAAGWAERWSGKQLRSIAPEEIEAYFEALSRRGRTENSLARERVLLRSFFRWAQRGGWTDRDPTQALSGRKGRGGAEPLAWTPLEQHLLLEGAQGRFLGGGAPLARSMARSTNASVAVRRKPLSLPPYLHPAVRVALRSGLRMRDVLALRWRHVDLDSSRILVPAAESSSLREIDVPLAEDAWLALDAIGRGLSAPPDSELRILADLGLPLWREMPDERAASLTFRAVVKRTGIRAGDFDALRTTFLRNCALAGVPAADAARLSDWDGGADALRRIYELSQRL